MKFDKKKIILLVIGVLLVVLGIIAIIGVVLNGNKNKYEEYYSSVEKNIVKNLKKYKGHYANEYMGSNLIFNNKSFNIKDLSINEILDYTITYVSMNDISEEIDDELLNKTVKYTENESISEIYTGSFLKKQVKELFNIDLKHQSVEASENRCADYKYIEELDVYIVTPSKYYNNYSNALDQNMKDVEVSVVSSTSTSKTILTTITVAYVKTVVKDDGELYSEFYKDEDMKDLVFSIKSSDRYTFEDGNLIENKDVDSMKKHEKEFTKYVVTSVKIGDRFVIDNVKRK